MNDKERIKKMLAKDPKAPLSWEEAALLINADDSELEWSEDEDDNITAQYLMEKSDENDIFIPDILAAKRHELIDDIMVVDQNVNHDIHFESDEPDIPSTSMEFDNVEIEYIDQSETAPFTTKENIEWRRRTIDIQRNVFIGNGNNDQSENEQPKSPLEYFMRYLPCSLFSEMAYCTNLYAVQTGVRNYKPATPEELMKVIGIHIFIGTLKIPRLRSYWSKLMGIELVNSAMSYDRFKQLRNNLHFVNKLDIPKENKDKFYMVRPLINSVRNACLETPITENLSVDEQVIPFKGQLNVKQYMKGKPYKWGIKNFVLCGKSGMAYDFVLYQGSNTELCSDLQRKYGFCALLFI